jgi:hypothetical protein
MDMMASLKSISTILKKDYTNDFLVLLNQDSTISSFLSQMDWMAVWVMIESSRKKAASNSPSPSCIECQSRKL